MSRPSIWSRFKYSFFSPEAATKRRNALRRDLARSPVGDMSAVLKCEGKLFPTTAIPIPSREAPRLPHWIETAIDGSRFSLRERCSQHSFLFLTISLSAYSEPQIDTFRNAFLERQGKENNVKGALVELYPLMTRLKWLVFSGILKRSLRNSIVPCRQSTLLVTYRPMDLLDALDVPNYYGGYVYLVDWEGRMRWKACGSASSEDLSKMNSAINAILKEYNEKRIE